MSLHFLLDGYNIIKQTSGLNQGTLESQREALLKWINDYRPHGSDKNGITVVFDGKEEFFGSHGSCGFQVVFSKGQSADDLIKKMVEQYPLKKTLIVVSNDKDITLYVRALGAGVLSVKEFMGGTLKKSLAQKQKNDSMVSSKNISLAEQAKINKEFERLWIKPDHS